LQIAIIGLLLTVIMPAPGAIIGEHEKQLRNKNRHFLTLFGI